MKRLVALVAVTSFALPLAARATAQDAALVAKGKKVYEASMPKCQACHSIAGDAASSARRSRSLRTSMHTATCISTGADASVSAHTALSREASCR